jgi:hypothetical protein
MKKYDYNDDNQSELNESTQTSNDPFPSLFFTKDGQKEKEKDNFDNFNTDIESLEWNSITDINALHKSEGGKHEEKDEFNLLKHSIIFISVIGSTLLILIFLFLIICASQVKKKYSKKLSIHEQHQQNETNSNSKITLDNYDKVIL